MSLDISACPYHQAVADAYEPFDLKDPFPFYKKAREEAPVFYSKELDLWVVTRYEDIKAVFANWQVFTSENAQKPVKKMAPEAKAILEEAGLVGLSGLSARIPPDHTRIRRIVSQAFGRPRFKKLAPRIRDLAIRMISAFQEKGKVDIIKELAYDLPAYVIFMLLGVPDQDVEKVKDWASSRLLLTWGDLDEEGQIYHAKNLSRYWEYCQNLVKQRHEHQSDDLPGDLVRFQLEGEEISDHEIATICYSQLFAGHETTTSLMGNGIRELLTYRHSWESICEDPSRIPQAIHEILRFSPSILSWRRHCLETTQVGDVSIPKGANLLLVMGSGNRDQALFEEGETFDIERANAKQHLSFGFGIHYCLGSPLAQLEFKIVLEELTQRLPSLGLVADQEYTFAENMSFRAPLSLWVEWPV